MKFVPHYSHEDFILKEILEKYCDLIYADLLLGV